MKNNLNSLINSLQKVIDFFKVVPNGEVWIKILSKIKLDIINHNSREDALKLLDNYFGGMGSLNDVVFTERNKNLPIGYTEKEANKKFEILLDKLFKDYKLLNGTILDKIKWEVNRFKNRKKLPTRILNAFSRDSRNAT